MGRAPTGVRGLVLTHGHSGHSSFAERLRRKRTVPVLVHEADAALARGEVPNPSKGFGQGQTRAPTWLLFSLDRRRPGRNPADTPSARPQRLTRRPGSTRFSGPPLADYIQPGAGQSAAQYECGRVPYRSRAPSLRNPRRSPMARSLWPGRAERPLLAPRSGARYVRRRLVSYQQEPRRAGRTVDVGRRVGQRVGPDVW
jgi:Metallo-beta-lactamase superfamily